jgi:two-component system cell cycle response regulator DivK
MNNSDKVVLLIEDNAANMKFCHAVLDAHGYSLLQATNGMEGLRMVREHRPDLILMDIQLPDFSGLEVTKWLKEDENLKSIPVIAVTAFAMVDDEERCRDSGCDGYISKPISIANLLQNVERFLDQPVPQASAIG